MTEIQDANDALALMGVKLTPLAEMYADLHKEYSDILEELVAVVTTLDYLRDLSTKVVDGWLTLDEPDLAVVVDNLRTFLLRTLP